MTENVRRRASKWDMIVESNFSGESRQGDAFVKETEVQSGPNSVNPDNDQFSLGPEMKSGITLKTDISQEDENLRISGGFLHANEPPKLAVTGKDIAKSSLWESDSGNRTAKNAEVSKGVDWEDPTFSQERNIRKSPGLNAWKRHSHNVSPRGGWTRSERSRSRSRSWSRSRSQSKSRSWSRSRSRSRSRSYSPFDVKSGSDRWSSRGRNRTGGQAPPCRDFAVGRCRRGSQCRFLHEDGGRGDYDRHKTHSRDAKLERGSSSWHNGKENFTGSWDQTEHSRNKPFPRQRSHYDDGEREKPELHRNSKSSELCFDFTKGRCHRGSACRYIHHEAASRGGWKDETREENYDRRDSDASFSQRIEPRRVSDTPCKFFAEGRCRRAQSCKFLHQEIDNMEGKPHASNWGFDQITGDASSKTASNICNQTYVMGSMTPSHWISGHDGVGSTASQSIQMGDPIQKHLNEQSHKIENSDSQMQEVHKDVDPRVQKRIDEVVDHAAAKPEVNSVASVMGQSFAQTGLGQFIVPQQLHAQSFTPPIQIPHAVSSLPFNGQMQQVIYSVPPNGQTQYLVPLTSDAQHRNLNLQSQSVLSLTHSVQNQQNLGEQIQQNAVPSPRNGQSQQNLNLSEHNPQLPLSSMNGQSQQNIHLNVQIQQNVPPLNQQSPQNVAFVGQSHQSLAPPPNGQIQENLQSIASIKQNASIEPPSDNSFKSDNLPTNVQKIPGEGSYSVAGAPEMKASAVNSTPAIPHKVVTSEQAARITDLSASLAHFFGNAPLNVSTLGMPLSQQSNSSSVVLPAAASLSPFQPIQGVTKNEQDGVVPVKPENNNRPVDPRLVNGGETSLKGVLPSSNTDCVGKHENSDAMQVELSGGDPLKEVNGIETGRDKNEQQAQENADEDAADGETKQTKDSKGLKMFKYALVEFVKDLLKPAWKEGQLSREAHKTIVKKVVDKVTGAVQTANIPQTQEKIDVYLAHSKSKLSKLVQAYVEKYVK